MVPLPSDTSATVEELAAALDDLDRAFENYRLRIQEPSSPNQPAKITSTTVSESSEATEGGAGSQARPSEPSPEHEQLIPAWRRFVSSVAALLWRR
jgi:hypothetical protein